MKPHKHGRLRNIFWSNEVTGHTIDCQLANKFDISTFASEGNRCVIPGAGINWKGFVKRRTTGLNQHL
jgi:hypothetical protein